MSGYTITVETEPDPLDIDVLRGKDLPPEIKKRRLGVFIWGTRDDLLGGVHGWVADDWLCVDTLWMDERLRGQGHGTRLMDAIEQAGLERGATRSFLTTASFQARPFYEKLGYQVFMAVDQFIQAHSLYFLKKDRLTPARGATLKVEDPPHLEDLAMLDEALNDFNFAHLGEVHSGNLAVFVRDANSAVVGGFAGYRYGCTLSLEHAWLGELRRAPGEIARLLAAVESALQIDESPYINLRFVGEGLLPVFQQAGYVVVGVHEDFPAGSRTYYPRKTR